MSTDTLMDKEDVVCVYNGILLGHKKERNVIWSKMHGPRDYHTNYEVSQTEKDKYMILFIVKVKVTQSCPTFCDPMD